MLSQKQHTVVIVLVQTPTKEDMPAFLGECINQSVKRWEVVTCNFFSKILPKFTAHTETYGGREGSSIAPCDKCVMEHCNGTLQWNTAMDSW